MVVLQPDLVSPGDKAEAEQAFKRISEAYAKLSGSKEHLLLTHCCIVWCIAQCIAYTAMLFRRDSV